MGRDLALPNMAMASRAGHGMASAAAMTSRSPAACRSAPRPGDEVLAATVGAGPYLSEGLRLATSFRNTPTISRWLEYLN